MISSKKITGIAILLVVLTLCFTIYGMVRPGDGVSGHKTGEVIYGETYKVTFSEDDYYSDYSKGAISKITLEGSTAKAGSKNVSVEGGSVIIRGGGTYVLSGTLSDGSIIIDSADDAEVRLVLCGADITASDFAALYVKQAEKVVLSLAEGTENHFTDGRVYNEEKLEDGKPTAAVYSKDALTINGGGTLVVTGNYEDGIKANDMLKVTEGSLRVLAADDGINANDYIAFLEANVEIEAVGDAVKCENESAEKGFVVFENTTLAITGGEDGIYASSSIYANGIKAQIAVTDDAIHGEKTVQLAAESIDITKCCEGIEGAFVVIDSGNIRIISSDDAINAVGENAQDGFGRPMGMGKENITEEDIYLVINGGTIYIETAGDGVDSNGAARVCGGHMEVYGPENNGNSSLDFEYGFIIDGGSVLAAGSAGMAELPADISAQRALVFYLETSYARGSTIAVSDSSGNVLISGTAGKKFDWVCASAAAIAEGETYTLSINDEVIQTVEATDIVTSFGNRGRRGW